MVAIKEGILNTVTAIPLTIPNTAPRASIARSATGIAYHLPARYPLVSLMMEAPTTLLSAMIEVLEKSTPPLSTAKCTPHATVSKTHDWLRIFLKLFMVAKLGTAIIATIRKAKMNQMIASTELKTFFNCFIFQPLYPFSQVFKPYPRTSAHGFSAVDQTVSFQPRPGSRKRMLSIFTLI